MLLLFNAQNCPCFVPSTNQAVPHHAMGSTSADEQFKWWDDLCFLETFPTAIHLLNSSKENQKMRFRQAGTSISEKHQWVLYHLLHWCNLFVSASNCPLSLHWCQPDKNHGLLTCSSITFFLIIQTKKQKPKPSLLLICPKILTKL